MELNRNRNWNCTPDQVQDQAPDRIPADLPLIILSNPCRHCRCLIRLHLESRDVLTQASYMVGEGGNAEKRGVTDILEEINRGEIG